MKIQKNLNSLLLTILMICVFGTAANGQSYIPASPLKIVSDSEAFAQMMREVAAARTLIAAQSEEIRTLTEQLTLDERNSLSLLRSYEAAKIEIEALRQANASLDKAVQLNQQTVSLLQTEVETGRRAKGKWKKRAITATLAAIGALLLNQ